MLALPRPGSLLGPVQIATVDQAPLAAPKSLPDGFARRTGEPDHPNSAEPKQEQNRTISG